MSASLPTTISNWLQEAQRELKQVGVDSYPLDSLVILEVVIKRNRAHILAHTDEQLTAAHLKKLEKMLLRRKAREPLAYITGVKEFYGREFIVDRNVLIPRPESENFIELLKKHHITHQTVIDVGTGSGILGVTTGLELPTNKITLTDIDTKALTVAKRNASKFNVTCDVVKSNLLPKNMPVGVVLANLPYVPNDMTIQPELNYEPKRALFADDNGLALYQRLWQQLSEHVENLYVLTESLQGQHDKMTLFAAEANYRLIETEDLVQIFRRR